MRRPWVLFLVVASSWLTGAGPTSEASGQTREAGEPGPWSLYWQDGLRLDSGDGNLTAKVGGRVMFDWMVGSADGELESQVGPVEDGSEFRRARLYMSGAVCNWMGYKLELEFADSGVDFKDAYLAFPHLLPFGELRLGHLREPFGLEVLTSSNDITFLERALPAILTPDRNTGIQLAGTACGERVTWALGGFAETDGVADNVGDDGWSVTGRVTALPWYEDEGRRLLHIGLSGSVRDPDSVSYSQRPEAHLAPTSVETGTLLTDSVGLAGMEGAFVCGPFSLQGEIVCSNVDPASDPESTFTGGYLQASCFLTGEHRPYERSSGTFGRVRPHKSFNGKDGWGAWEVAARWSCLDLDDGSVDGGELTDLSVGLNWYLNPNIRIMWNYVHPMLDAKAGDNEGDADLFVMRVQIAF